MARLRLVTFNIKVGVETDTEAVARAIASLSPDILAMQEVGSSWIMGDGKRQTEWIAQKTGLPHWVFSPALVVKQDGIGRPVAGFGVSILSRWPLSRVQTIKLSSITDEQRILVLGQIEVPAIGQVTLANTHLSFKEPDRVKQVQEVKDELSKLQTPIVFFGDLNDVPGSYTINELESLLYNLHRSHLKGGALSTYPTPIATGAASRDYARWIDHIMINHVGSWEKIELWVAKSSLASDHWPLVADLYY